MLIFDGAMGTLLTKHGIPMHSCMEICNITHPNLVKSIHASYIKAGCDVITTNTFGANALRLKHYNLNHEVTRLNIEAISLAKASINTYLNSKMRPIAKNIRIAGSMGPTGNLIRSSNIDSVLYKTIYKAYKEQATILAQNHVDYLLLETMMSLTEAKIAIQACKELMLPILCQFSFSKENLTYTEETPEQVARELQTMGVAALGINCSFGPKHILPLLERMHAVSSIPLIVQPNAGIPTIQNSNIITYVISPKEMASYVSAYIRLGVQYIGTCCGSTPEYTKALVIQKSKLL